MDKSTFLPPELKAKGVGVGVAVLLSSADDNVLVIIVFSERGRKCRKSADGMEINF